MRRVVVLFVLLSLMAVSAWAIMRPRTNYYFTDAAFTDLVGQEYDPGTSLGCDDYSFTGQAADYKMVDIYDGCGGVPTWRDCYHNVNGVWQLVQCPN